MANLNLNGLDTESRNEKTMHLDEMSPLEIVSVMNEEDGKVIAAVRSQLANIAKAVEHTSNSLRQGGRIVYIGAGTSGRLGVLDAVECPPTFGVDEGMVVGLIAGGEKAFVRAKEGAEDSTELGAQDLQEITLNKNDTLVGLAASGRTPYVIGAMKYARSIGCITISVSCNNASEISALADVPIELLTGPEILTGSTRLKAGTAEKMVLNMISTASMIEIGKVYKNLMVDVKQTNHKLACRAENIVMQATGCSRETAQAELQNAKGAVKPAITKLLLNTSLEEAEQYLTSAGGKVKKALLLYQNRPSAQ